MKARLKELFYLAPFCLGLIAVIIGNGKSVLLIPWLSPWQTFALIAGGIALIAPYYFIGPPEAESEDV